MEKLELFLYNGIVIVTVVSLKIYLQTRQFFFILQQILNLIALSTINF